MAQADPDFLKGTLLVMKHGSTTMIQNQGNSRWNGVTPTPKDQRNFELKRVGRSSWQQFFWDIHGVICVDILSRGVTIDSEMYIQTLKKLKASPQEYIVLDQVCKSRIFCFIITMPRATAVPRQGK